VGAQKSTLDRSWACKQNDRLTQSTRQLLQSKTRRR